MDLKYNEAQSDVKILWNKKYYEVIYIKTLELFKRKLSLTFKVLMLLYVICNAVKKLFTENEQYFLSGVHYKHQQMISFLQLTFQDIY